MRFCVNCVQHQGLSGWVNEDVILYQQSLQTSQPLAIPTHENWAGEDVLTNFPYRLRLQVCMGGLYLEVVDNLKGRIYDTVTLELSPKVQSVIGVLSL